jgi:hypothetical protein
MPSVAPTAMLCRSAPIAQDERAGCCRPDVLGDRRLLRVGLWRACSHHTIRSTCHASTRVIPLLAATKRAYAFSQMFLICDPNSPAVVRPDRYDGTTIRCARQDHSTDAVIGLTRTLDGRPSYVISKGVRADAVTWC